MRYRMVLSRDSDENKTRAESKKHPRLKFLAQGCLSLKPCKNCHFDINLNAIQHSWLGLWGFFPKPDAGGEPSSAPIDKLSHVCRKPLAGKFCRAVMQTLDLLFTMWCSSCAGLLLWSLFANHSIILLHCSSMVTLSISFFTNAIVSNGRITKHLPPLSNLQSDLF